MNNIFVDLGTHMGSGLLAFINMYKMTPDNWEIHTFEPQPKLFELAGKNTTTRYVGYPYSFDDMNQALKIFPTVKRYNAAASDEDGQTELSIEKGLEEMHMGSSIFKDIPLNNKRDFDGTNVLVQTVNIHNFIRTLIQNKKINNLIIKMDIEGAEFIVLNKFLQEFLAGNTFHGDNIELYCEFHHRCVPKDDLKYPPVSAYKTEFAKFSVKLHEWH